MNNFQDFFLSIIYVTSKKCFSNEEVVPLEFR